MQSFSPSRSICLSLFFSLSLIGLSGCKHGARFENGVCSIGTEQLNTAMVQWADRFQSKNSAVENPGSKPIIHEGRGTSVAPQALEQRICDLAPMSRPMHAAELNVFIEKHGGRPIAIPVAIEALAIVANHKASISAIDMQKFKLLFGKTPATLGAIFSDSIKESYRKQRPHPYGLNSATDRYRWVRQDFLSGNYSDRVLELSRPADIARQVAADPQGFAYLRPAEANAQQGLKILDLASSSSAGQAIQPDLDAIQSGRYAITRLYYIYLPPYQARPATQSRTLAFLDFILSDEAQAMLLPLGLYPPGARSVQDARQKIELYKLRIQD